MILLSAAIHLQMIWPLKALAYNDILKSRLTNQFGFLYGSTIVFNIPVSRAWFIRNAKVSITNTLLQFNFSIY